MGITSETEALQVLDDNHKENLEREEAVRYLAEIPKKTVIERLVQALQDDDFGVRWEASVALSKLGKKGLPILLRALMDPQRVGDPRLRRGAFRVLKGMEMSSRPPSADRLMEALHGPAADIVSMEEAYKVFCEVEKGSK